ncbi:MAG: hypothetical protein K0Q91_943 [Fibrobacteria bacterium]|nr:hypothetical protein [Fibrobacteria bacterium]
MLKSIFILCFLGVGLAGACSYVPTSSRIDTLSSGTVQVVVTTYSASASPPVKTGEYVLGPFHQTDLNSYFASLFRDSALVFIAHLDSIVYDSTVALSPQVNLVPVYGQGAVHQFFRARLVVDTIFRGTLVEKKFWIRTHMLNSAMCGGVNWEYFLGKRFLNASTKLERTDDIRLPYQGWGYWNPAYWFDGRYLIAPAYPGLRMDITALMPTYPATGILRRPAPARPVAPGGKAYQPDGRRVQETRAGRPGTFPL